MKRSEERSMNLNLDVLSYSKDMNEEESALMYLNCSADTSKVFIVLRGDPDIAISSFITLFESVEGAFALFLDAVQTYAGDNNIDIATYWDAEVEV